MKSKYVKCTRCGRKLLRSKDITICGNCIKRAVDKVRAQRKEEPEEPKRPCTNCGYMTNGDFICSCGNILCESCSDDKCCECREKEERKEEREAWRWVNEDDNDI